jgi:hypothetical protein
MLAKDTLKRDQFINPFLSAIKAPNPLRGLSQTGSKFFSL